MSLPGLDREQLRAKLASGVPFKLVMAGGVEAELVDEAPAPVLAGF